jgi:hypothetical protein
LVRFASPVSSVEVAENSPCPSCPGQCPDLCVSSVIRLAQGDAGRPSHMVGRSSARTLQRRQTDPCVFQCRCAIKLFVPPKMGHPCRMS